MCALFSVMCTGYLHSLILLVLVRGSQQVGERDVPDNATGACANCLDTMGCERAGVCTSGCQLWWTGSRCDTHIVIPDHDTEYMSVIQVSMTSVVVIWQPLQHLPQGNYTYYQYLVTYRKIDALIDEKGPVLKHDPSSINVPLQAIVATLQLDTHYQFKVWPFRQNMSKVDYGEPYEAFMYTLDDDGTTNDGAEEDLGGSRGCDQTLAWALFGVTGVITCILCVIIAYLVRKYVINQPRQPLIAPNPEDSRVKFDTGKYRRGVSGVAARSTNRPTVGSIASGGYEEPVNYYTQHIASPAPYESLDPKSHVYENNSGPYEGLKTNQQSTSSTSQNTDPFNTQT